MLKLKNNIDIYVEYVVKYNKQGVKLWNFVK